MNYREQLDKEFFDAIGQLKAQAERNFAIAADMAAFVEKQDMPDPMQAKLYAMQDKDTEYGRRKNDVAGLAA